MTDRQPVLAILGLAALLVIGVMVVVVPMLNRDAERAAAQDARVNATVSGWLTRMAAEQRPEATLTLIYAEARRLAALEISSLATATAVQQGQQAAKQATQAAFLTQAARSTDLAATPTAAMLLTQTAENDQRVLATLAAVGTSAAARNAANVATLAAIVTQIAAREAALNAALLLDAGSAPRLTQVAALSDTGPIEHVRYSPDGAVFATASEQSVTLWRAQDATRITSYEHNTRINDLAFSPDSAILATALDDGAIWLWSAAGGARPRAILRGHKEPVFQVVFSPDGALLASAGADQTVIWEVAAGRMLAALPSGWAWSVAFSPGGRYIVTAGGDGSVRIWGVPIR